VARRSAWLAAECGADATLHEEVRALHEFDELKSRIIEQRFFGGLYNDEVATALGISASTLDRELRLAKAWLKNRMG
jgi:DNA-directed RNA polymerase specialized sigma24 family protein